MAQPIFRRRNASRKTRQLHPVNIDCAPRSPCTSLPFRHHAVFLHALPYKRGYRSESNPYNSNVGDYQKKPLLRKDYVPRQVLSLRRRRSLRSCRIDPCTHDLRIAGTFRSPTSRLHGFLSRKSRRKSFARRAGRCGNMRVGARPHSIFFRAKNGRNRHRHSPELTP